MRHSDTPVQVAAIARSQRLSAKYLHALLKELVGAGLVESVRGAHGGYRLARGAAEINLRDALRALEGRQRGPARAASAGAAAVGDLLAEVSGQVEQILASFTLEDLTARTARRNASPMYFI